MSNFLTLKIFHKKNTSLKIKIKYNPGYFNFMLKMKTIKPNYEEVLLGGCSTIFSNGNYLNLNTRFSSNENLFTINGRNTFLDKFLDGVKFDAPMLNKYESYSFLREVFKLSCFSYFKNLSENEVYGLFNENLYLETLLKNSIYSDSDLKKLNHSEIFKRDELLKLINSELI